MSLRAIDAEWRQWKVEESGPNHRYEPSTKDVYVGPWHWHLVYTLTRAAERTRDSEMKRQVKDLVASLYGEEIATIGLSARWAEFLTRSSDDA